METSEKRTSAREDGTPARPDAALLRRATDWMLRLEAALLVRLAYRLDHGVPSLCPHDLASEPDQIGLVRVRVHTLP